MRFRRGLTEEDCTNSGLVAFMRNMRKRKFGSVGSLKNTIKFCLDRMEKKSRNFLWSDQMSLNLFGGQPEETFLIQRERNFTQKITNYERGNGMVWRWFS